MSFHGNRCLGCNVSYFPARAICGQCGHARLIGCELSVDSFVGTTEVLRGPGGSTGESVRIGLVRISDGLFAICRK